MNCVFCDVAQDSKPRPSLLVIQKRGRDQAVCLSCLLQMLIAAEPILLGEQEYLSWATENGEQHEIE